MPRQRSKPKGRLARYLSRRFQGLTLEEVAERTGLDYAQVSRHLAGSTKPREVAILHYAAALGEHPAELHEKLGREDVARLYRVVLGEERPEGFESRDPVAEHLLDLTRRLLQCGRGAPLKRGLEELEQQQAMLERSFEASLGTAGTDAAFLAADALPGAESAVALAAGIDKGEAEAILEQGPGKEWERVESVQSGPKLTLYLRDPQRPASGLQTSVDLWRNLFFR